MPPATETACIQDALAAVDEAAYCWLIDEDRLIWSAGAWRVLGIDESAMEQIASGRGYAALLENDNLTTRYDTVMYTRAADDGDGVRFAIEYTLQMTDEDGAPIRLEDCGRWHAGEDGKPAIVRGVVRRLGRASVVRNGRGVMLRDPNSGLLTHHGLMEALEESFKGYRDNGGSFAFVAVSVDNLDVIIDAYGHRRAGELLALIGRRLREVARSGDTVAHLGDSRFGLIVNDCTLEDLNVAIRRFLMSVNTRVLETETGPVWAMASVGGVILPDMATDVEEALFCVEEALSKARQQPLCRFAIYEEDSKRSSERRINARLTADIIDALHNRRFTLAFQPVINAESGKPWFYEALLRLKQDDGRIVPAVHLIPLAEKLGIIRLIDFTVAELALITLRDHPGARLSINLSGYTALDPFWQRRLLDLIAEHDDLAARLLIEITETATLDEPDIIAAFIARLREQGCEVAIDDFGSGHTSYKGLKLLKPDVVKLDGSYCHDLTENQENAHFVRALIDMADKIGFAVVAEWVRGKEDAALLREWGVRGLQGHLFGAADVGNPWPAPELETSRLQEALLPDADESDAPQAACPKCVVHSEEPEAPETANAATPTAEASPGGEELATLSGQIDAELRKLRELLAQLRDG